MIRDVIVFSTVANFQHPIGLDEIYFSDFVFKLATYSTTA